MSIAKVVQKSQNFLKSFQEKSHYRDTFNYKFYKTLQIKEIQLNNQLAIIDKEGNIKEIKEQEQENKMMVKLQSEGENELQNAFGVMHGGAVSSYIDITTTLAIYTFDRHSRGQLSVKLNVDYLQPVHLNTPLTHLIYVDQVGKTLAFSHSTLYNHHNQLLALGTHTKTFINTPYVL